MLHALVAHPSYKLVLPDIPSESFLPLCAYSKHSEPRSFPALALGQLPSISGLGQSKTFLKDGERPMKDNHQRLGSACLALHYANIITQIDTLVARSGSVPLNSGDALYHGLPPSIKSALRFKVLSFSLKEELTVPQIKDEMEKTFQWLVPMATNTLPKPIMAFDGLENGKYRSEIHRKSGSQVDLLQIETLYRADKEKTEEYILDLLVWLHHLVSKLRSANAGVRSPVKSPIRSPNQKMIELSNDSSISPLTVEDQEMLRDVSKRKLTPGISKSQEFTKKRVEQVPQLSKSSNHSPINETRKEDPFPIRRPSSVPVSDFDNDRTKALDVIDRVYSIN